MRKTLFAACAALALVPLSGHAQFAKPEDAIKYRKAAYTVMGTHFARIGAMVQGKAPFDAQQAQTNAAIVEAMSKLPFTAFGQGTESGLETRAKPEIWREADKFHAGAEKMQKAVSDLYAVTKTGNEAQIKTAFGNAAQACKACHDNYRKE